MFVRGRNTYIPNRRGEQPELPGEVTVSMMTPEDHAKYKDIKYRYTNSLGATAKKPVIIPHHQRGGRKA